VSGPSLPISNMGSTSTHHSSSSWLFGDLSCVSSNLLFMAAVGLVFAPLAPLVPVAACIVFWMGSWVYKYQLMFVYVSKVESGGVGRPRAVSCAC
jgi:Calcium-dependent channel, 7TM region, putative phosphate